MQLRSGVTYGSGWKIARAIGFFILTLLIFTFILLAAQKPPHKNTITFDPAKTTIRWTLRDVVHTVHGAFELKSGVVNFDSVTGAANGLIEVAAASGMSGNAARDQRMSQKTLESDRYPVISFRPTQIYGKLDFSSDQMIAVNGIFRMHGEDHALQLHVKIHPQQKMLTATTHFVVPYVQWGLKDPSTFILRVSKTVDLDVEGTVATGKP